MNPWFCSWKEHVRIVRETNRAFERLLLRFKCPKNTLSFASEHHKWMLRFFILFGLSFLAMAIYVWTLAFAQSSSIGLALTSFFVIIALLVIYEAYRMGYNVSLDKNKKELAIINYFSKNKIKLSSIKTIILSFPSSGPFEPMGGLISINLKIIAKNRPFSFKIRAHKASSLAPIINCLKELGRLKIEPLKPSFITYLSFSQGVAY